MYRIDNATAVPHASGVPTPGAVGPNLNGYFTKGNPGGGVPATIVDHDWANHVQEEISNVIEGAGITLDKTKMNQLLAAIRGLARTKLTADANYYVAPTGNDANAGTVGAPWLTLQHAWNYLVDNVDLNGFRITINCADTGGSPYGPLLAQGMPLGASSLTNGAAASPITFLGNAGTPANCAVTATNASCFTALPGALFNISGFALTASGGAAGQGAGVYASGAGARINVLGAVRILGCDVGGFVAASGGQIYISHDYALAASLNALFLATDCGTVVHGVQTCTITGTPAFGNAAAVALRCGSISLASGATFSGAATGLRFNAILNGVVDTSTTTPNAVLPGGTNGTTATGGQAN